MDTRKPKTRTEEETKDMDTQKPKTWTQKKTTSQNMDTQKPKTWTDCWKHKGKKTQEAKKEPKLWTTPTPRGRRGPGVRGRTVHSPSPTAVGEGFFPNHLTSQCLPGISSGSLTQLVQGTRFIFLPFPLPDQLLTVNDRGRRRSTSNS